MLYPLFPVGACRNNIGGQRDRGSPPMGLRSESFVILKMKIDCRVSEFE
jgi:hypothetical protein